ncbi:hypothetical protein QIS99_30170 [Streptomyces sp. B-S-A8]|uniref:Secreted protein n=1 Tax=Streptomyces solicavernae TaxID=3043614 RepID=A0ABT6S189_9ACTN|nr:hypothetical protein [Streptomyces sp. B-S-A8]MDI3390427.1 hypothetical protein [Streptomyces sp. B-S-A8]
MKARRALTAGLLATGLVLTMSGCGGEDGGGGKNRASSESTSGGKSDEGNKEQSHEPTEEKVLAEVSNSDARLVINSAVRDQGGFLTVSGTVTNISGKFWNPSQWRGDEKELNANGASMAGAALVDKAGKKRYLILRDTGGRCLCTQFTGGIKPNEAKPFFAQFPAPPQSTTDITFQIADMPPADIQITEGE